MADYIQSPTNKYKRSPSFFGSPRLLTSFVSNGFWDTHEAVMSPTSILDSKSFSALRNPFSSENTTSATAIAAVAAVSGGKAPERHWEKLDGKGVGLSIVDYESDSKISKPESRMVLFGSQLKIQIPQANFNPGQETPESTRVFAGCLTASEMELSEDYTCVITHGPNPKTTHIFDNCIVESCCISGLRKENGGFGDHGSDYPSESFLSLCYNCKKQLGPGKDIYMFRGEKAFCSHECRYQEMLLENRMEKLKGRDNGH